MQTDDPQFEEYQARFEMLAEQAIAHQGPQPDIASAKLFLCLYGENAMTVEQEFAMLDELSAYAGKDLHQTTIQSSYWEELILFVPGAVKDPV